MHSVLLGLQVLLIIFEHLTMISYCQLKWNIGSDIPFGEPFDALWVGHALFLDRYAR